MVLFAAVTGALLSCTPNNNDFSSRLVSELKKEKGTVVKFSELTDFEWTTVYVYGPYQPIEEINKKHKTNLKDEYHLNHVPEGDCLFIFENQGKPVSTVTIPRYKGGCFEILDPGVYSKQNAVFEIMKKPEGPGPQLALRSNHRVEPTR